MAIWKNVVGSSFLLMGHGGKKFVGLIMKLGEVIKGQDRVHLEKVLEAVKVGFSQYI